MADNAVDLTLSSGVVLTVFKPSLFALRSVERQMNSEKPKPPEVYIEDKDRSEPNPSDPDYMFATTEWQANLNERHYNAVIITGTRIKSVPETVIPLESTQWHDMLSVLEIPIGATEQARYVQWIKFIAAPAGEDYQQIYVTGLKLLGVQESEVAEAVETFRGDEVRGADNPSTNNQHSENRDIVRTPSRRNRANL